MPHTHHTTTDVTIIGAGLTGLVAAYYLKKRGAKVIILDKSTYTGGVVQTGRQYGYVYELGPNTGVVSSAEVMDLFDDLWGECDMEVASDSVNKRLVWKKGNWHNIPMSPIGGLLTPLFSLRDKLTIPFEIFRTKGHIPHETLESFVKRRMGQSFMDYAIDPFVLGVYAGDPNYLVTKYAFPKLYDIEQKYGSLTRGIFSLIFGKKEPGKRRPTRKVFSVKGGLHNLIDVLEKKVGSNNIRLGCEELHISKVDEGFEVIGQSNGDPLLIKTKSVISAVSAYEIPNLFPFIPEDEKVDIANLKYARVAQISLGFKKWDGMDLSAFGGLVPFKEDKDILGVLFMSSLFKNRAPAGGALLSVFMGGVRKEHLMEKSDDEIIKIVEAHFKDMLGVKSFKPDLIKISRYRHAIAQYGAESGKRFTAIQKVQEQFPGLILAGNIIGGIGMADRIRQGREIADNLKI